MIAYRTFRNGDPPALARIWNCQPQVDMRLRGMTAMAIDEHVLSKPYFDRQGLFVAIDDQQVVGFAHAGFGPSPDGSQLDRANGATLMLMVEPRPGSDSICSDLLQRCEQYLRAAGTVTPRAGSPVALNPFYWGLTGGCGVPGVLSGERQFVETLERHGYRESQCYRLFGRRLPGFRPPFDRQQMQWHRTAPITLSLDQETRSWWESHILVSSERTRVQLGGGASSRQLDLRFWDLRPLADGWGERGQGVLEFRCDEAAWTDGLALYAWAQTLAQFQQQGVSSVSAGAAADDVLRCELFAKLGFQETATARLFEKGTVNVA